MITTISAEKLDSMIRSGQTIHILDVRTGLECKTEQLGCNFIHIPLHELNAEKFVKDYGATIGQDPLYILCRSGGRAMKAAQMLEAHIPNLVIIEGGITACKTCSMPIKRTQTLSLERQVRIAAGSFVLIGALLGFLVSTAFFFICAFVGAGLVFAGITDKCGMALILARAPWNKTDIDSEIQKSLQQFQKGA